MATVKKKKMSFGKKIKRVIKKTILNIMEFFEGLYKKFMSLKDYVRYIIYVWTVIFVLLIILIAISASNSKYRSEYAKIEESVTNAALTYVVKNELYPLKTNKLKLSVDMLKDYGYLKDDDISDKTCVGYAKVYYDGDMESTEYEAERYNAKAYINCKKYTTDGYKDNK